MTNTSANVNEQGGVRLQTMAKLLLERIDIKKDVLFDVPFGKHSDWDLLDSGICFLRGIRAELASRA